jgi:hypothetical protein
MSRHTRRVRRQRRALQKEYAALGEALIALRDERRFEAVGYSSFDAYVSTGFPGTLPADWGFSQEQAEQFAAEALGLAETRRRHDHRAAVAAIRRRRDRGAP